MKVTLKHTEDIVSYDKKETYLRASDFKKDLNAVTNGTEYMHKSIMHIGENSTNFKYGHVYKLVNKIKWYTFKSDNGIAGREVNDYFVICRHDIRKIIETGTNTPPNTFLNPSVTLYLVDIPANTWTDISDKITLNDYWSNNGVNLTIDSVVYPLHPDDDIILTSPTIDTYQWVDMVDSSETTIRATGILTLTDEKLKRLSSAVGLTYRDFVENISDGNNYPLNFNVTPQLPNVGRDKKGRDSCINIWGIGYDFDAENITDARFINKVFEIRFKGCDTYTSWDSTTGAVVESSKIVDNKIIVDPNTHPTVPSWFNMNYYGGFYLRDGNELKYYVSNITENKILVEISLIDKTTLVRKAVREYAIKVFKPITINYSELATSTNYICSDLSDPFSVNFDFPIIPNSGTVSVVLPDFLMSGAGKYKITDNNGFDVTSSWVCDTNGFHSSTPLYSSSYVYFNFSINCDASAYNPYRNVMATHANITGGAEQGVYINSHTDGNAVFDYEQMASVTDAFMSERGMGSFIVRDNDYLLLYEWNLNNPVSPETGRFKACSV